LAASTSAKRPLTNGCVEQTKCSKSRKTTGSALAVPEQITHHAMHQAIKTQGGTVKIKSWVIRKDIRHSRKIPLPVE
jgi:hypothetical protein